MIRIAIAVLAGYLVMTTMVLLTLQPATMLIDIDRLRDADTGVMTTWFIMVVEWPVAIFTAILGGVVAAVVAGRDGRAAANRGLVTFVLLLGLVAGGLQLGGQLSGDRGLAVDGELAGPTVDEVEVASVAEREGDSTLGSDDDRLPIKPWWDLVALPFVGALGVLLGGRLVARAAESFAPIPPSASGREEPR